MKKNLKEVFQTFSEIGKGFFRNLFDEDVSVSFYPYYFYHNLGYEVRSIPTSKKVLHKLANYSQSSMEKIPENEMKSPFEYSWKNLIILDACRYDLFSEAINQNVPKRYTLGSGTGQYIGENYSRGDFSDIVYISGNPQFDAERFKSHCGREIDEVFFEVFQSHERGWDERINTVDPEVVMQDSKTAEKLFPEKKKIIHFLPPHLPIIPDNQPDISWTGMERQEEKKDLGWKAYRENLLFVLKYIEELSCSLSGKTMITADHGNLFGSNGVFGHHTTDPIEGVRKVPMADEKEIEWENLDLN